MSSIHSLVAGVEFWADRTPDATAVIERHRWVSYGRLRENARLVAGALTSLGAAKGDRITYVGKNSIEQIELTAAAAMLGAMAVPVNWRLSAREIGARIDHMDATVVVVQSVLYDLARAALKDADRVEQVIVIGEDPDGNLDYGEWKSAAAPLPDDRLAALGDEDPAVQLYTSGTSGAPKGVMLGAPGLRATVDLLADIWGLAPDAVLMPVLPWFHVGGIGAVAGALFVGCSVVAQNEVSGGDILAAIERYRVTSMVVAPIMIQGICAHPAARTTDTSSLRLASYGGSPVSRSLLREFGDLMPHVGLLQVYGLTETWGTVATLDDAAHHDADHRERLQSAGRAVDRLTIRLVDPHSHRPVGQGDVGEVWVNYVGNMLGYYKLPEQTEEVLTDDGYLRTNDLGWQDEDGFLFLCDRVGDMIVSGGENIFPSEVEEIIATHPDVSEVAVVGLADPKWGETPKAYVVPVPGASLLPRQVIEHARDNLAHYKCPATVELVESLPRNASGKVLRRVLRDLPGNAVPS